jgi:hypothetical protein
MQYTMLLDGTRIMQNHYVLTTRVLPTVSAKAKTMHIGSE